MRDRSLHRTALDGVLKTQLNHNEKIVLLAAESLKRCQKSHRVAIICILEQPAPENFEKMFRGFLGSFMEAS